MAEERLQITVTEKGTRVVKRNLDSLGSSAQKAGGGVKLLRTALGGLATIGLGAVLASSVKTLASFGQEMSTVQGITGSFGQELKSLREEAQRLGTETRFSATQAAQGMTFLARAGFDATQVLSAIGPTLQLAQAGALDLASAADIASNVLTGFNIVADESQRVIDVLALAANSANTDVRQLGEAMSYVAPIASSLNVSLEETAGAVEVLSNAGIQASRAGTNLTMVMRLMQAPTKKQLGVLNELHLSQSDVNVSQVGLTQAMLNMRDAGITTTQMFKFFGRSAAAANVLLRGAEGQLQDFTAANEEAGGTAKEMADIMDQNLNGALLAVRSAWEGVILASGEAGADTALTNGLLNLANALRTVAGNLELTVQWMGAMGVAVAAVKFAPLLSGVSASTAQFLALRQAAAAGTVTMLGSAKADAQKAASALAAAQAEAKLTASLLASANAKRANLIATNNLNVSSQFRINTIKQATVLEAKHAVSVNAVSVAQARSAIASKAAAGSMLGLSKAVALVKTGLAALALNPITVGLVALAAAVAALTFAFNEYKKLQEELERIEEATYKMRLKHVQAQVAEIHARKAANKALANYMEDLELENHMLGLSAEEKEREVSLTRALEIAKRDLTDEEKKAITALLEQRDAIRARNDLLAQEEELLASIKGPQQEFASQQALLNSLLEKGKITDTEYAETLAAMREEYAQAGPAMDSYLSKLQRENELLKLNAQEREVQQALDTARGQADGGPVDEEAIRAALAERRALTMDDYLAKLGEENRLLALGTKEQELQQALAQARAAQGGGDLTPEATAAVTALVQQKQATEELNAEQEELQRLYENIKGPQLEYEATQRRLNELFAEGSINLAEHTEAMADLDDAMKQSTEQNELLAGAAGAVWNNAARAIDEFAQGGKFVLGDFVKSVIADFAKLAAQMALMKAFQSIPGFAGIGGAANGASFTVGGSGGVDSQIVAFKATPGEQVDVTTPAQQAAQEQGLGGGGGGYVIQIVNVVDPSQVPEIMSGPAGQESVLNTINLNPETVRQATSQ